MLNYVFSEGWFLKVHLHCSSTQPWCVTGNRCKRTLPSFPPHSSDILHFIKHDHCGSLVPYLEKKCLLWYPKSSHKNKLPEVVQNNIQDIPKQHVSSPKRNNIKLDSFHL